MTKRCAKYGMILNTRTGRYRNGYTGGPKLYCFAWLTQALNLSIYGWNKSNNLIDQYEVILFDSDMNKIGDPISAKTWYLMKGFAV